MYINLNLYLEVRTHTHMCVYKHDRIFFILISYVLLLFLTSCRNLLMQEMMQKYNIAFRDISELNQATTFLHENGKLVLFLLIKMIIINEITNILF